MKNLSNFTTNHTLPSPIGGSGNFTNDTTIPSPSGGSGNLDGLIFFNKITTALMIVSIESIFFRACTCAAIVAYILLNWPAFIANRLFVPFFLLLLFGNLILIGSDLDILIHITSNTFTPNLKLTNILAIIGVICIDAFFGLIPNLFYSVYKSSLDVEKSITARYFMVNFVLVVVFFLVALILNFVEGYEFACNFVVIIELLYTTVFYSLSLRSITKLPSKRHLRILSKFFAIFLCYGTTQIARSAVIAYQFTHPPDPHINGSLWASIIIHNIMSAVLLGAVVRFLREFKMTPKNNKSSLSGKSASKSGANL